MCHERAWHSGRHANIEGETEEREGTREAQAERGEEGRKTTRDGRQIRRRSRKWGRGEMRGDTPQVSQVD